jgi:hypothetical protein
MDEFGKLIFDKEEIGDQNYNANDSLIIEREGTLQT